MLVHTPGAISALSAPAAESAEISNSAGKLSSKQLYMEVVKQLSKDSYGAGQVPISAEVLQLLSAQQEHIVQQEQRLNEYEKHIKNVLSRSQDAYQEFTITQVE